MATTVNYNGRELPIRSDDAEDLLVMFRLGGAGVAQFFTEGGGTIHVAYGPGIPVIFESTDD